MNGRGTTARDVVVLLLLLLFFLFTPMAPIRFLSLFFFLVVAVSSQCGRLLPRAFVVRRSDEVLRLNRLERITVTFEVRNRWPFPVRSLLVTDGSGGTFPVEPPVFLFSLPPRGRTTLSWQAVAHERGEFHIGPVTISGPGPFGMHPWRAVFPLPMTVIVYPAVYPLTLEHRRGLPAGNIAVLNRLYEDVSRFRSLREYAPGDELRRINWKVSARLGKLHSMEYLPSLYFPVLVLLNLTSEDYPLHARHAQMERAIEIAGSLIVYFIGLKQEVGLAASGAIPGEGQIVAVPIRAGNSHGVRMLEALARVRPRDDGADFLRLAQGPLASGSVVMPTGTRILVVTPPLTEERRGQLRSLARRGLHVEAFFVSSQDTRPEDASLPGLASHAMDDASWGDLHA